MNPTPSNLIILGADHAGFGLKESLKKHLGQSGFEILDVGCHSEDSVDYPCVARDLAQAMTNHQESRGIICCGSGVGVSIGVNRFTHIRAVLAGDETTARLSRQHNDANVLCLGSRLVASELAVAIARTWLETPFEGGRHQRRVDQLTHLQADFSKA